MAITPEQVRDLRQRTGAGVMDCKRALTEAEGEMDRAVEILREQGILRAARRESRPTADGTVASYVHAGGKIGVLVEVNCETDFVARTPELQAFAHDVAMQIAAQQPVYLGRDDVPEEVREKEKEIYRAQALGEGKPEKILARIAEGKLEKFYQDVCLLEQPFIRDPDKTIEDLRKELAGKTGENVRIRRFARFQLGECEG
ncbi:MAG: translation elongation factor Ts [Armatimonadota bacterium]|nr:MAG: translation elongation factor Ts [Armatimonadota bacterium]